MLESGHCGGFRHDASGQVFCTVRECGLNLNADFYLRVGVGDQNGDLLVGCDCRHTALNNYFRIAPHKSKHPNQEARAYHRGVGAPAGCAEYQRYDSIQGCASQSFDPVEEWSEAELAFKHFGDDSSQ
jgi:hypothetical protein